MNITKTTRIIQIPMVTRQEIENDIKTALIDFTGDILSMIKEALEGRLCDIEDLIDISKYLVRI